MRINAEAFYERCHNQVHLTMILIVSVAVLCRLGSLSFLMGWDDQTYVTNHFTEDGLSVGNMLSILSEFYSWQYAPINQLYYCVIFWLCGYNTVVFHIASLVIHVANASLVYALISKVGNRLIDLPKVRISQIAFLTAVLFSISPENLESVAWVAAAKVLLYSMFYLLSLLCYIRYIETKKALYFYGAIIGFILSFGAKEQAVTLPACLLLIDYAYRRAFNDSSIWFEKAPFAVLGLLFGLATLQSQGNLVFGSGKFYPAVDRVLLFSYSISEYFTKILLPVSLSYAYPFPFQINERPPLWLYPYPMLISFALFLLKRILSYKWVAFGLLFFFVHIFLVCNLFSLARNSAMADRYAYMSSVGLYFLIAAAFILLYSGTGSHKRLMLSVVCACYVMFFSGYTNVHSSTWKNAITLKERMRETITKRADYKRWLEKRKKRNKEHDVHR